MKWRDNLRKIGILIVLLILGQIPFSGIHSSHAQSGIVWSEPEQISSPANEVQWTTIAADGAGNVHMMWSEDVNKDSNITGDTLFYAKWDGQRWTFPRDVLVSPGGAAAMDPELATTSDGWLLAIWITSSQGGDAMFAKAPACCADEPANWSEPKLIAGGILDTVALAVDKTGELHLAYAPFGGTSVYYKRSQDNGDSWTQEVRIDGMVQAADEYPINPRLAVDGLGRVHLVWSVLPWPGRRIVYARSEDGGEKWSQPTIVDSARNENYLEGYGPQLADIYAAGDSEIHMSWDGAPTIERNHIFSTDGGQSWSEPRITVPEVSVNGRAGWNPMAMDDAGLLHLVSMSPRDVWHSAWDGQSWSRSVNVTGGVNQGPHFMHMTVNLGNELHVTWLNKATDPPSAWHAVGQTSAPRREPIPLPATAVQPSSEIGQVPKDEAVDESPQDNEGVPDFPRSQPAETGLGSEQILLVSILPALILIFGAVLFMLRARKT